MGLQNSARVLRETIDQVELRLAGNAGTPINSASVNNTAQPSQRVIPRNAWVKK
jgi:hypothetical protein